MERRRNQLICLRRRGGVIASADLQQANDGVAYTFRGDKPMCKFLHEPIYGTVHCRCTLAEPCFRRTDLEILSCPAAQRIGTTGPLWLAGSRGSRAKRLHTDASALDAPDAFASAL